METSVRRKFTMWVATPIRYFAAWMALLLCLLPGCAGRDQPGGASPSVAYALDGPPLFITAQYGAIWLEGTMDRTCMVGIGKMQMQSGSDASTPMYCEARLNQEPTEKGRVRGVLDCTDGVLLMFSLRNLGPDQGVGIAKPESGEPGLMVLFYHSSKEESKRRFPGVLADLEKARKN